MSEIFHRFGAPLAPRSLRSHQKHLAGVIEAIVSGQTDTRDILAAVTPGGGKSLLPVIAAARLIAAGIVERMCWIVPRDSLRLQAEEAFTDPAWRAALGHSLSVRAADNAPDPSRGLNGYITTYQAIAAAPDLHLAELRRYSTLLVVDEVHHLPALADTDPAAAAEAANVARGYGLNANQVFNWRRALTAPAKTKRRAAALTAPAKASAESQAAFVSVGMVVPTRDDALALASRPSVSVAGVMPLGAMSGKRAGLIEIDLICGTRLRVDAFVDGRALRRVLSAMKASS